MKPKSVSLIFNTVNFKLILFLLGLIIQPIAWSDTLLREQTKQAMSKASDFFTQQVSGHGGYLWKYSPDLELREGEKKADPDMIWVQPPGTPSVGEAFIKAFRASGNKKYLKAALEAAYALEWGQLQSGGWWYSIDFNSNKFRYRHVDNKVRKGRNISILDDNVSQSALMFLMHLDEVLEFKNQRVNKVVEYGLDNLLKAQYPNGAWPQRFDKFPNPDKYPVIKANYPQNWPREFPGKNYYSYYTFNDNSISDTIVLFFEAYRIYGKNAYLEAAERGGDFILLAQMPEPQPVWAQQYNHKMQPAWARKFEPAALSGRESQDVMKSLLMLYRETGKQKYLDALPRAFRWFERSILPEGKMARFYELRTNRPLYFTKDYQLVYHANDLPTHYYFKVKSRIPGIKREYEYLKNNDYESVKKRLDKKKNTVTINEKKERIVRRIISELDKSGRWLEDGKLRYQRFYNFNVANQVISSKTFVQNMNILSDYLLATQK